MTEIGDLPPQLVQMIQQQQQGGRPNPEFEKAAEAFHKAAHDFERQVFGQVQFFGAVLCSCERRYEWGEPHPPQMGCPVHGFIMTDQHTGAAWLFGIPEHW